MFIVTCAVQQNLKIKIKVVYILTAECFDVARNVKVQVALKETYEKDQICSKIATITRL